MSTRRAARLLAGLTACLSALPGSGVAAHAEPAVEVKTLSGTVVGVGDVIAVGERSGSMCTFPDGSGVVMTLTSGSAGTRLHVDDSCRVSVQAIEVSAGAAAMSAWAIEPKHPDSVPSGNLISTAAESAIGGIGIGIGVISGGKPPKTPPPPEPTNLWTGHVVQTFSNQAGQPQWRDQIELDYAQGVNSGTIVTSSIGQRTDCAVITIDPTTTYTNVKSNCTYHHTSVSGPYAELTGTGTYQQTLLGTELASATPRETFFVTKTNYGGSCPLGSAPAGWDVDCHWDRV